MRNQFFYTRKEPSAIKIEGKEQEFKIYRDSFNIEKVIRTITMSDERLLVLLDDLHQRYEEVPLKSLKGNPKGTKRELNTFQTEIFLENSDAARFYKLTNIEQL